MLRERLHRLRVGVAGADELSVRSGGRRPGDVDDVADADGARVADDRLPRRAARDVRRVTGRGPRPRPGRDNGPSGRARRTRS